MSIEEDRSDADKEFCAVVNEMTKSISAAKEVVQGLLKNSDLDMKDGISLLSLKHHLLLSYMQSLTLLSAHRVVGHSLATRSRPTMSFTTTDREARGAEAGDLVDSLVENRIVLEKVKQLESKMRYQIEKLVKVAEEGDTRSVVDVINDPLAFRPNPQNLVDNEESASDAAADENERDDGAGIYRPPRMAPVPYTEKKDKSRKRAPVPSGLAALSHLDGSKPHIESSSGLGAMPSMASARAQELSRMNEFEEENFTRLVMTKKEARRRARDEEDVALGGTGTSKGRRRGGGLEDEFGDVLRAVDKGSGRPGGLGDGYEALRVKGRKQDVLSRSRTRQREDDEDVGRVKKKSRFQSAVKNMAKKHRRI